MSIASEITRLQEAKADLKTAINSKTDNEHQITTETIDDYADFVDSIQTGGSLPTKGIVFNEWNNDGYPTKATFVGFTDVPNNTFDNSNTSTNKLLPMSALNTIVFDDNNITIGDSAFRGMSTIINIIFGSNITTIGMYSFNNCTNLEITQIPDGVAEIKTRTFYNTGIKKLSMNNVTTIYGGNTSSEAFGNCTKLKKVWIGSAITSINSYSFYRCANLENIYIDRPRSVVTKFGGYSYAFMGDSSKKSLIICNDDEGFIDKATFDALVVE